MDSAPFVALALAFLGVGCISAGRRPGFELTEGRAKWVANRVSAMRGIDLPTSAPVDFDERRERGAEYERLAQQSLAEDEIERRIRADRALGLVPPQARFLRRPFMASEIGVFGSYDPETKQVVVINDLEGGSRDDLTLAHELGHRLDDSRWSLQGMCIASRGNGDRALATLALIEGSALAVQLDYALSETYEDILSGSGAAQTNRVIDDLESDLGLFARVRGGKARELLAATPRYLRERIVFPYARGLAFVRALRVRKGTAGVNEAFSRPPLSTSQILHPEKLADRRQDPVRIALRVDWLAGEIVREDTLGEFGIRQCLKTQLSYGDAVAAATGWAGDRYCVKEVEGRDVLLWHTEWDDPRDAQEFAQAADKWLAARYGATPCWMEQLGFDNVERPDGRVAQIRLRGRSVVIADGAPAASEWGGRLLDEDVTHAPEPEPSAGFGLSTLLTPLVGTKVYDDGAATHLLGGLLASDIRHGDATSFSLFGGALFETSSNCDGSRTSILFGLISWRSAPRQELTRIRGLISAYGEDNETVSWSVLPIFDAPAYSRAPGHRKVRFGIANYDDGYRVSFDADGIPSDGEANEGGWSYLLGLVGRSWLDDHEPDGTPMRRTRWFFPFDLGFSHDSATHGPLGPSYEPKAAASGPGSGPASRPPRVLPGDVDEVVRWQSFGELLASYQSRTMRRGDRTLVSLSRWSILVGLLGYGWSNDPSWFFATPLVGWAEVPEGSYLLLLWGAIPIHVGGPSSDTIEQESSRPTR